MSANTTEIPVDPASVHPEHSELTPQNENDWTDEQIDQYRRAKKAQLHQQGNERRQERAKEEQEALEAIESAVGYDEQDDEELIERVALTENVWLKVQKRITGDFENAVERIQAADEQGNIRLAREAVIDAIVGFIVDDSETGSYRYTDRKTWEAWHEEYGMEGLMDVFQIVSEPAMERQENLDKFRVDDHRRNSR